MQKYFTGTFFKFLFGFLVIIVAAFSVLVVLGQGAPKPVDNVAQPQ
ncbi:hypothetical protein K2Q00_00845 [Patescibacteria group bacterium]|nr:hypothetical protein [Patescibacteria group bacterium]